MSYSRGNPHQGRLPKPQTITEAEQTETMSAEMPSWLDPYARSLYVQLLPSVMETTKAVDLELFAHLCQTASLAVSALLLVQSEGIIIDDAKGSVKKNPALQVYRDQVAQFNSLCGKFGFSPADRTRIFDTAAKTAEGAGSGILDIIAKAHNT